MNTNQQIDHGIMSSYMVAIYSRENLTVPEVAKIVGVTPQTVYKWIRKGQLPAKKFGGTIRVHIDDIQNRGKENGN
jgi:excisionase family DNA binding protein